MTRWSAALSITIASPVGVCAADLSFFAGSSMWLLWGLTCWAAASVLVLIALAIFQLFTRVFLLKEGLYA